LNGAGSTKAAPMTPSSTYLDKKTIAELTARMYLDTGAVRFMQDKPYIFTSGWASPVYNDSRWLISFPHVRNTLMDFATATIARDIGRDKIDAVAGGETAGIPFAALVADRLQLPMQYVRKKSKGFGRNAQIEGQVIEGERVLLVEDLATDGKSKANFIKAIRDAGAKCDHCFVLFFYDIYPQSKKILGDLGVTMHALTTWRDVLATARQSGKFDAKMLTEVEKFINDPAGWSKAHGGASEVAE
jgi:orotate phosphoribosyltransferase